jgi:predicted PurR-regulated permease PerM
MSESFTPTSLDPTSLDRFPPARPALGPRAPTTRARRTFWALFAVAVALTIYVVWPFRSPLFLAAVLAAAFQPLLARTEWLLKGRRRLAGALLTLLVFAAIVAPIASILAFIAQEITQGLTWVRDSLGVQSVGDLSLSRVPPQAQHAIDRILSTLHLSREQVQTFAAKALDYAQAVGPALLGASISAVASTFIMLAAFFFLLVDGRHLIRLLGRVCPLQAAQTEELLQEFANVSSATLVGAALTAAVQAVLATIGFALAGVPHAVFLGITTLVASFVPVIGTALVWIPAAVLLVLTGHVTAAIFVAAWCGVLLTAADNVVKPLAMRGKVEMHTGLVFLALLGGITMFGLLGIIAGPLVIAFLLALLRMYERDFAERPTGTA